MSGDSGLIEFYGTECLYCTHMEPLIERLLKEEGIESRKLRYGITRPMLG